MVKAGSLIAAVVAAVALAALSVQASSSKFFQAATQADFLKGEVTNLSIDSQGRLMLGPATELVYETSAPFLWALAAGPDGSLFVGTGNEGRVFRVDPQGRGSLFFDAPELEVHALAPAPDGGLYVATSPDGRIYRVDRNGKDSVFFDPDDNTSVAGGRFGRQPVRGHRREGAGLQDHARRDGTKFYDTKATHAMALTFDQVGNLLVGTGTPGRVGGRCQRQGLRAARFADDGFERSARRRGLLYIAALSGRPSAGASPAAPDISSAAPAADSNRT